MTISEHFRHDVCSRNLKVFTYVISEIETLKWYFLHIVMKVALFYTQNRSESSTFLHEKS
ncbi:unnamed protein product [Tenebrio molitor]|nr:unnamed protein product [Tenebrio molitor]